MKTLQGLYVRVVLFFIKSAMQTHMKEQLRPGGLLRNDFLCPGDSDSLDIR